MPPKRVAAKKKKQLEEFISPSISLQNLAERGIDVDKLFCSAVENGALGMMEEVRDQMNWLVDAKNLLKQKCVDAGAKNAFPKTPKRGAVARVKETVELFENLSRCNIKDESDDGMQDTGDEGEDNGGAVKTNGSPIPNACHTTPRHVGVVVKEEVMSASPIRDAARSSKQALTPSRFPALSLRHSEDDEVRQTRRPLANNDGPPTLSALVRSPSRRNGAASPARTSKPAQQLKQGKCANPLLMASPGRPRIAPNAEQRRAEEEQKKKQTLAKLEEKKTIATANRIENIREKAEKAKREREERQQKVQQNRLEEQRLAADKLQKSRTKEAELAALRLRAASPALPKSPARALPSSAARAMMKRAVQSPLTPRVPHKQHRAASIKREEEMDTTEEEEDQKRIRQQRADDERRRRIVEEEARLIAAKKEEERVARIKEEERKREEDRKRKEEIRRNEEATRRREEEQRLKEEKAKKDAIPLVNKHLGNVSLNHSSYDMTPDKVFVPASETNYGVDDLSSGDETDEEDHPRKAVPKWATPAALAQILGRQRKNPPFDADTFFGPIMDPSDLTVIFPQRAQFPKRTSSAMWSSPITNPTMGKSRFFSTNH